jgi:hypothetical protein
MGPLFVVLPHPLRTDFSHLIERLEHVGIKHLVAEGPIESFHKGILIRLARLNKPERDPTIRTPDRKAIGEEFRAIVKAKGLRLPRQAVTCSSTRITRSAGNEVSTSIATTSRTPSSRIFKVRNRHPPYTVSLMKSSAHTTLGCGITSIGCTGRIGSASWSVVAG